ncbi:hypothetical protein GmRootV59_30960 [Variovorax sp. V59]|uniref:hypothetical protein n=1 Tax=unclassified Variovorax TaxID=663243 RepID=UPI0034E9734C
MTKLWPALLAAALLSGCAAPSATPPATPVPAAPAAGAVTWQYVRSTWHEARLPGLGVSHRYESRVGWVDVYLYDLKQGHWQAGVDDPRFAAQFESSVNEVRLAVARGLYAEVEVGPITDVRIEGQDFRRVSLRIVHAVTRKAYESFTFLTARDGRLLKYRMSFDTPAPANVDAIAREFIEHNLRSGPDMPRAAQPLFDT